MSVSIREMRTVEAIAVTGSATRAAELLGITQPAVSQIVRKLEERLGGPLFHRSSQGMTPTEVGERLLRSARIILGELDRFSHDAGLVGDDERRVLRLGAQCYAFHQWIPGILERFHRESPGADVHVERGVGPDPGRALREGRLDVAIVDAVPEGDDLMSRALFEDELVALLSDGHPLAARELVAPEDFAEHVLLVHGDDRGRWVRDRYLARAGVTPRRVLELERTEAVVGTARAGLGVAVLPRWAAEEGRRQGMAVRSLSGDPGLRGWHVATRVDSREDPEVTRLVALIRTETAGAGPSGSTHTARA